MDHSGPSLKKDRFSKLPRYWLKNSLMVPWGLRAAATTDPFLNPRGISWKPTTGEVTAALKIYITLVAMADDKKQEKNVGKHSLQTTYEEIQLYLKLSRSSVREGLRLLEATDAVERLCYKPLAYRIKGLDQERKDEWTGFAKLPKGHIFGNRRFSSAEPIMLAEYPNRGESAMNGLLLYLFFLSVCQRDTNVSLVSYRRIGERTGIYENRLRRALDVLINHDLISVLRLNNESTYEAFGLPAPSTRLAGTPNAYLIKGLAGRKYNERVNTLQDYIENQGSSS